MVGGPSDVVVEANIVRATSAAAGARGPAIAETAPRAIPLPEIPSNGSWPLQPESTGPSTSSSPPRRVSRIESAADEANSLPPPIEPPSRSREPLATLADDLAANPLAPTGPNTPINPAPPRGRSTPPGRPLPVESQRPDPRSATQPTSPEAIAAADKTLAEMAQRLEAALRKPKAVEATPSAATPGPDASTPAPAQPTPMRPLRPVETKTGRPDNKGSEGKAIYETLEQEMANLLGRQPSKG
jgi:hypothetical protein